MISIGIDVSKRKSTVYGMDETGVVHMQLFEFEHERKQVAAFIERLKALPEEPRVVLENTGYYHWPVVNALLEADVFVCIVNPILMSKFSKVQMRPWKTDKLDAIMICKFGLAYWKDLIRCIPDEESRAMLKLLARQYDAAVKLMVQQKATLSCLLDKTLPGIQTLLRDEAGRSKLSEFVLRFWHFDRISKMSPEAFTDAYCSWAKKRGYRVNESKAQTIYALSQTAIPILPATQTVKFTLTQAARVLIQLEASVYSILSQMYALASSFPEFEAVIAMKGVGPKTASRLIAEIGDVRRFHSAKALVAFAGIDAPPFQSGDFTGSRRKISKRGNKYLRKVGFEVMQSLMSSKPSSDNAVYRFICKKRLEGKHYLSAYMAGLNKFLHIYYARVMPVLSAAA